MLVSPCNFLFLLSIFFANYFLFLSFFTFSLEYCKYRMPHAACGRVEFIYFLEIYLYCTCRGIVASGHHPGLNENEQISAICVEKYGWWSLVYNSPRGLESLVPADFWDPPPPPPPNTVFLYVGLLAKIILFVGQVVLLYTGYIFSKLMFFEK